MRLQRSFARSLSVAFAVASYMAAGILGVSLFGLPLFAQDAAQAVVQRPLITQPIDESRLTTLKGNTHPLAKPVFDLGTAPATLPLNRMLLVLKRSPDQEYSLRKLIDDQQDKASPSFHKWLTPEDFGKRFGPTDSDIQTITSWLQSYGFQVSAPSKGRTVLEFSGSASQVREAFHTAIHKYVVNGEQHWANASDPMIPEALTPAVAGVLSLHNFPAKAFHKSLGPVIRNKETGQFRPLKPLFTVPDPNGGCGVQGSPCYGVGPYDFATIYDVLSLWNTTPVAIDGTGETIAIVAETEINAQDVTDFRNFFGLPAANFHSINDGPSPGIVGDETESDLDVQWSGAVAKGAAIDFVISAGTDTTFGVALSAQYIVDTNLAPVMSMSYGLCELATGTAGNQFYSQLWQQAAAQGITAIVSSGDNGAAGCDPHGAVPPSPAQFGLEVTGWGDSPYNVSVGGTDFFDLTNQTTYWNSTNAATTQASARSYIPEATWNNTCTNSVFGDLLHYSTSAETNCNNSQLSGFVSTDGGSGGLSNCTSNDGQTVASCTGGYPQPSWQTGPGFTTRAIPDISLFAAAGSPSGSFYIVCEADQISSGSSCNPADASTGFLGIGGTSASAPAFAGIMALVNQLTGERQGNANYVLYQMATQFPTAFHDVTQGTIRMPCLTGSPGCTTATGGDAYGVLDGYDAAPGYDLATGLGSIDAAVLLQNWATVAGSFKATTTTLALGNTTITHGQSETVNIAVTAASGTPVGDVTLIAQAGIQPPSGSGQTGIQQFTLDGNGHVVNGTTTELPGGTNYQVHAHYTGNGVFGASDSAPSTLTVNPEGTLTTLSAVTSNSIGQVVPFSSGPFGSFVYVKAQVTNSLAQACQSSACPSGSVNFTDSLGSLPQQIFQAVVNPSPLNSQGNTAIGAGVINFDEGSHTISGTYSGDISYTGSTSTQSVTFTIQSGFALVSGFGNVTITSPGLSGTTTLGMLASSKFTTPVTYTCAGLPSEATCGAASATGQGPNTIVNTNLTISTTAPHITRASSNQRHNYLAIMLGGGLPLAGIFVIAVPRRRRVSAVLGAMVLLMLVTVPACGGGSGGGGGGQQDPGTPTGTYNITVTATAGSLSSQASFLLVVQ